VRNNHDKNKITRIIIVCVLFALAAGLLGFSLYTRVTDNRNLSGGDDGTIHAPITANAATMEFAGGADTDGAGYIDITPAGWWEDLWKIPEEIAVYGTLHAGDYNTTVSRGSYTNKAFGFTAPQDFPQHQIRTPGGNADSWTTLTGSRSLWSNTNINGWYYFRGYKPDPKGDYSYESGICLDTVKPQIQARINGSSVANGTVTTSAGAVISVLGSDDRSGVSTYWYRMGGGSYYQCYASSTFSGDGVYTFYCVDRAGNVSDTVTVTKDTAAPAARAYNASTSALLSSGTVVNAASVRFEATDSTSGVYGIYVRAPGASTYTLYTGASVTFSTEGLYYYYARDNAGNLSATYTVMLDRTAPSAALYSGTTAVSSGYYSAAGYVRFTASDTNGATCYMRKDGGGYSIYASGANLTAEGVYSFYAVDPAGNTTSTYTITLDRTAPVGTLYAGTSIVSSGKITNADYITYTATDNLALNFIYVRVPGSAIYSAFPGGTQFTADGWYYFYATDRSGNASSTVSILLDKTKPTATIYGGADVIASGGYTNASSVSFSASDGAAGMGSGIADMYVRLPNTDNYISYVSGTPFTAEGIYYFYATDAAGNIGDTVNVTLDKTVPVGTLTVGGAAVASGTFTNKAFYYTATDSLSGISKLEIRRPGGAWETYTSGTTIAATSTQGLYSFRATDRAGNVSVESQITLVSAAPATTLYAGTTVVTSGTYTNKTYVAFTASGTNGASVSLFVKMPGAGSFTAYTSGTQLTQEGAYSFYATDNAGNTSATVTITLDISKPVGTVTANGSAVQNGGYVNTAFKYSATDSVSGILRYEILRPSGAWQTYGGEDIAAGSGNGLYSFRAIDRAGNVSDEYKVNLVTSAPTVQLYAEEQPIANGIYTSAARISMSASGTTAVTCYIKTPGAGSFTSYTQYFSYTAAGRYEFYAEDAAGNKSGTFFVIVDRTAKAVTLSGVKDDMAVGNITAAWTNGNIDTAAPIVSVTVNGVSHANGGVIRTIDGGAYTVKSTDAAGNVWTAAFTAARTDVLSSTLNKEYWEVGYNGQYYSFASYNGALTYAKECEAALVKTGTWSGAVWDVGIAMDAVDSVNAKNGTYYIYKKSGDKTVEVAYFTLDRLNTVITEYAVETIKSHYYWQKTPADIYGDNDLYGLKADRVFIGDSVTLGSHANYLIDGVPFGGLVYSTEGIHTLTVCDDYGNSYEYLLKIVRHAPEINYMAEGGGVFNTAAPDRQYRLTKAVTVKITDGIDDFAMFYIKNNADEVIAILSLGEEYTIDKSGRYTVQSVNHSGVSEEIVFVLSLNSPTAIFTENGQSKRLELRVTASPDSNVTLTDLKIYKSTDDSSTWTLLSTDDYGRVITPTRLFYEFNKDGVYRVVIEDTFRSGIDAVTTEKEYVKPAPEGVLTGVGHNVADGGFYANGIVKFTWTDEAFAYLTRGDITSDYVSGTAITEQGEYTLEFCDDNGYSKIFTFTIDTVKPVGSVTANDANIPNGGYTNKPFSYSATDNLSGVEKCEVKKPGGAWESYTAGATIPASVDGWYSFRATDKAGNVSEETTICLVIFSPVITIYAGTDTLPSGAYTNKDYVSFTAKSALGVIESMYVKTPDLGAYVLYNDKTPMYAEGSYYFYAIDSAGNVSDIVNITLDKTAPEGTVLANGAIMPDGSYVNKAIRYSAADSVSGIAKLEIKRPNGTWEIYDGGDVAARVDDPSGDGWYSFRATDKAGNISEEISICIVTIPPTVTIYAGGAAVPNGTYTNKGYITFAANGALGAAAALYVQMPDTGGFVSYTAGNQMSREGVYYFYAVDEAGNTSETVSVTLDMTAPVGEVISDVAVIANGGYTNKAFSYSAIDALSEVVKYEIKRPDGAWETYTAGAVIPATLNGWYAFRSTDAAGNISEEYKVCLIVSLPEVGIYAESTLVPNGAFTNKEYVSFTANSIAGGIKSIYVKAPSSSGFTAYIAGTPMYGEGIYYVYAVDSADNESVTVSVTLDKTKPVGTLTIGDLFTNKAFSYSATDNGSGISKLEIQRPGGAWEIYTAGTAIAATSANGLYSFRATDKAGNVSDESKINLITSAPVVTIYAGTAAVSSGAYTNNGYVSFTAAASLNATASLFVQLPNAGGFISYAAGTPLYGEGIYRFYATDNAGNVSDTVNVTLDMTKPVGTVTSDGKIIPSDGYTNKAFSYSAADNSGIAKCEIKKPDGVWEIYTAGAIVPATLNGWYAFRSTDNAGNISDEYRVCLIASLPVVTIYAEGSVVSDGTFTNREYVGFTASGAVGGIKGIYVKAPDSNDYALYTSGTSLYREGIYYVYAVDSADNASVTVSVFLDKTKPVGTLTVSDLFTNKAFSYSATDNGSGVSKLEIKRPNGNWETYSGEEIAKTGGDGLYSFRATDKAGNVSDESKINLITTAPAVTIYAGTVSVPNGTYTNGGYVSFAAAASLTATASLFVQLPGAGGYISYAAGTPLYGEGVYHFYAADNAGNKSETVSVTLDTTKPAGTVTSDGKIIQNDGYTNKAFSFTATDSLSGILKLEMKRPGGAWETYNGEEIVKTGDDGLYLFRATDKAGNVSDESRIYLITSAPNVTIYAGTAVVQSGAYTNKGNISFTAAAFGSATASLFVKMPDAPNYTSYISGTPLYLEGTYYFYAGDNAGNMSATVNVTLDMTKPVGMVTSDGAVLPNDRHTNKAFSYSATDALSGVAGLEIKRPGGAWETYNGEEIARNGDDGLYSFRATDKAGNVSDESMIHLITSAPVLTVYAGTEVIQSGAYTNNGYVSLTAAASLNATASLFVKLPNASGYIPYTAGTPFNGEGTYYFYATDNAGNVSGTVSVTLDMTKPVGIVTSDGATISNDGYTNKAFSYTATDSLSGAAYCEVKRPNGTWETYAAGTEISAANESGWYAFRAVDNAGNISDESRICLMTALPDITVYAGTTVVASGTITNNGCVSFTASDALSGANTLYVRMPGASEYTLYIAGTQLFREGVYCVYATDAAGNKSEEATVTLDMTNPVGTVVSDGAVVQSGGYTNKAFSFTATDSLSGVAYYEVKRPNAAWETYAAGSEIPAASIGGWYAFRAVDAAGNVSDESRICLITTVPGVTLYADEQPVTNGAYTNAARISMSANGDYVKTCFVKLPDASGYIPYTQFFTFTAAGRYEFYAEDYAGGASGVFTVIIDRALKPVTLNGVSGGKTAGDVTLTWENGNPVTAAPIVSVTVNGIAYAKGSVIKTIDGGVYVVASADAAGNIWTAAFTAARREILSETLNKQYFESVGNGGQIHSFAAYDNALAFATTREAALVTTGTWNGDTWDGGIPMDYIDSANAKNGAYYIYKKSGDSASSVAYFTLDRLNAVIAEYAAASVSSFYWWEKVPAASYGGNDIYSLTADRIFVGNSVSLAAHANYLIDGAAFAGNTYSVEGEHTLTVYDDYGNSYEYTLVIVRTAPDIMYRLGEGAYNKADDDRQYVFKEAVTLKIEDALGGGFAMYIVKNSAEEIIAAVSCGDEYTLSKSGRYYVYAINHAGKSSEITFVLSLVSPTAAFTENAGSKRLELRVEPSADGGANITDIKIYKSVDGETWVLLAADDYGRAVNTGRIFYEFNRDGLYRVVVEDNFRSGIDAVTAVKEYKKPAPNGTLHGVSHIVADGGKAYTNTSVRFVWTDEAQAAVTFNGETAAYLSGTELTEDGEYVLTFYDANGFEMTYTFIIKTTKPAVELSLEPTDGYLTEPVSAAYDDDCSAVYYKDGELVGAYVSGTEIDGDGEYEIVVTDLAGNTAAVTFTLDTTPPAAEIIGVKDGGKTSGGVVLRNLSEPAAVKVYLNGNLISYRLGDNLTELGVYRVALTDDAGNVTEYNFEIIYAVNTAGTMIIFIVILGIIGGIVAVSIFRRRSKFKAKNKAKNKVKNAKKGGNV